MNNLMAKRDTSKHRTEYIKNYKVFRQTSIFSDRYNGVSALDDVWIQISPQGQVWGALDTNGNRYINVAILKAESGDAKRGRVDTIPPDVMEIATNMLD